MVERQPVCSKANRTDCALGQFTVPDESARHSPLCEMPVRAGKADEACELASLGHRIDASDVHQRIVTNSSAAVG